MSSSKASITRVQNQIDKMDSSILELLKKRFEMVKALHGHQKMPQETLSYLPSREAKTLRSILKQNKGDLPLPVLAKIWREIISAEEQSYTPFSVAVYTKECAREMMELAKDYFGSLGRYIPCLSIGQAIQKVDTKEAGVVLLPLFEQAEESWWTTLSSGEHKNLKIIAKLPFCVIEDAVRSKEAFVVGTTEFTETGQDRSLFAIEMASQASIASLRSIFEDSGLVVHQIWPAYHLSRIYFFAVELDGFVTLDDKRIQAFKMAQEKNILVLRSIGGYAVQELLK